MKRQKANLADFIRSRQFEETVTRPLARTAKSFAKGAASAGDLAALPINAASNFLGYEDIVAYPSSVVEDLFSNYTNGLTNPQNELERYVDTIGESLTPSFGIKGLNRGAPNNQYVRRLTPETRKELAGIASAGAGLQYGREEFPESALAQVGTSIGGAFLPGGIAKTANAVRHPIQTAKNLGSMVPTPVNVAKSNYRNFDLEEAIPAKEAAKRLGIHLRPSETTGNPFVAAYEGKLGKNPKSAAKLYESGKVRQGKIEKAIEDIYETTAPQGTRDKTKALYAESDPISISQNTLTNLMEEEPILAKAINRVLRTTEYESNLKGYGTTSTKFLDLVKRDLDDKIAGLKGERANTKAAFLTEARDKLVSAIDEVNPVYAKARAEAQKDIIRNAIERKASSPTEGGKNFYNKILKDNKGFKDLYHKLKNNPDAQERLKDMRLAFKNLIEPVSTEAAASQARGKPEMPPGVLKGIKAFADKVTKGAYDNAAVELILNPEWEQELKNIARIKDPLTKTKAMESIFQAALHPNEIINEKENLGNPVEEDAELQNLSSEQLQQLIDEEELSQLSSAELQALIDEEERKSSPIKNYLQERNQ
jgi:hypothetical protein